MESKDVALVLENIALAAEAADRGDSQLSLTSHDLQALRLAAQTLHMEPNAKRQQPASAGARWDEGEDVRLCSEFDGGMTIGEIALAHGRTRAAINLRLVKLGRIDATAVRVRDRASLAHERKV